MTPLEAAMAEAYASAPAEDVVLHTLELRHASFTQPLRVVLGFDPVLARLEMDAPADAGAWVSFIPYAFSFKLPAMESGGSPWLDISIDNVALEIEEALEAAALGNDELFVTYRTFLSHDLSAPAMEKPLTLPCTFGGVDDGKVSLRAALTSLANASFPTAIYTEDRFPWLIG